jgi:ketosteroid isomerase-like protein
MITAAFAERFAADWIAAWNRHDLDALLAHCADDIELTVPRVPAGRLRGKRAVAAWWARALTAPAITLAPRLQVSAATPLTGIDGVVLLYRAGAPLRAESFRFGADGQVKRVAVHQHAPRVPDPTPAPR